MTASNTPVSHLRDRFIWPVMGSMVFLLRLMYPARGMDETGVAAAIVDNVLALALFVFVFLVALGVGFLCVTKLRRSILSLSEELGLSLAAGLGVLSLGFQLLGWVGWLQRTGIWALLIVLSAAGGHLSRSRCGVQCREPGPDGKPAKRAMCLCGFSQGWLG